MTYRDADDREWPIRVTVATLERCRDEAGYDPLRLVNEGELHKVHLDPTLLAALAWCSVEAEAGRRGVTRQQFVEAVRGDAIDRLLAVWVEAFASFFPARRAAWIRQTSERIAEAIDAQHSGPSSYGDASTNSPASPAATLAA